MATILDGTEIAKYITNDLKKIILTYNEIYSFIPGLAIIIIGNRQDSSIYVNLKKKKAEEIGIYVKDIILPENVTENNIINTIKILNKDDNIHGIVVQLPLPKNIDEFRVLNEINVHKDVDCFHQENLGKLMYKGYEPSIKPCTPNACIEILNRYGISIKSQNVVILGRSNIVGKPLANMLTDLDATVTLCHSKTKNISEICSQADILIVAIGKPHFVQSHWIKPGSVVLDVGINSIEDSNSKKGYRIIGDVNVEAENIASFITKVPGGIGPMTIAMLLQNVTILAGKTLTSKKND